MKLIPLLLQTNQVESILCKNNFQMASSLGLEKANQSKKGLSFVGWAEHQLILQNKETFIICSSPYQLQDIVYIRETCYKTDDGYIYKSDELDLEDEQLINWISSNKMPREAVRLFYKIVSINYTPFVQFVNTDLLKLKNTHGQEDAWIFTLEKVEKPKDFNR